MDSTKNQVTKLLDRYSANRDEVGNELFSIIFLELKKIARSYLARESDGHTLQPTALVNEAYIKLLDQDAKWQNRKHFYGIAAKVMRRILVDYARAKNAQKRGGEFEKVSLDVEKDASISSDTSLQNLVALDSALSKLEDLNSRQAHVVELKYFTGLTNEEIAKALNISVPTVKREWVFARSFLQTQLST